MDDDRLRTRIGLQLSTIPLRRWLPGLIFFSFVSLTMSSAFLRIVQTSNSVEKNALETVRYRMLDEQARIEHFLRIGTPSLVDEEIAQLSAAPNVKSITLVDEKGQVLYSSHRANINRSMHDVLPEFGAQFLSSIQGSRHLKLQFGPDRKNLFAYQAIAMRTVVGEIRPDHLGGLLMEYDLSSEIDKTRKDVIFSSLAEFAFSILVAIFLTLMLRRWFTQPLEKIYAAINRISDGNFDQLFQIVGTGELADLGKKINQMQNDLRAAIEKRHLAERALLESEDRFRTIANSAPVLIWIADTDKLCVWFNQPWLNFTGRSMKQELGNGWAERVHPDDFARCLDIYVSHFDQRAEFRMNYRLRRHDGEYRWIHDNGIPRFDMQGVFQGYTGSCIDITEQIQLLDQLKEAEQRWSFALEGTGEGVWDWDLTVDNITFSKRWYEIQGFEVGSIGTTASDWQELVHPDDLLSVENALQAHFEGKTSNFSCEHRVRCKNGEYKWILGRGMVVARDSKGKVLRAIGTHFDITDRKIAELERNRLLAVIMEAPDFIASSDMEANLTFINPAGARLVGLPKDCDITTLQIKDMHPAWATKRVLEEGVPAVLRQGYWHGETALLNSWTGQEIPVSQLLLLHRDKNGVPRHLSTIMRDITSFKEAEQSLRKSKEIAESLSRTKSEFLANMSHEIRTPMNGIIGLSQLALNQPTTAVIRDYLQKIYSSSKSLLGILNDVLDFSKMEAGRMSIENRPFNLDQIVDNLRNLFEERIRAKHLALKIEIAKEMPRDFVGDAMRIQQILSNLIGNAEKFTSHGHVALKIWVKRMEGSQAQLCCAVEDTGIGIAEDDL